MITKDQLPDVEARTIDVADALVAAYNALDAGWIKAGWPGMEYETCFSCHRDRRYGHVPPGTVGPGCQREAAMRAIEAVLGMEVSHA